MTRLCPLMQVRLEFVRDVLESVDESSASSTELSSSNGVSIAELAHNPSVVDSAIKDDSTGRPSVVVHLGYT